MEWASKQNSSWPGYSAKRVLAQMSRASTSCSGKKDVDGRSSPAMTKKDSFFKRLERA
jgi:hypothetical protein